MTHFDKRFTGSSGTVSLMEDLGDALHQNPEMIFMGGGNPAQIPAVEACFAKHLEAIAKSPDQLHKMLGEYQPPQGDPGFRQQLADFFSSEYDWPVTMEHIAISNGGQSAFFLLFNMLAGKSDDKPFKKILLPLMPDYLGYADAGLEADMFVGLPPRIQMIGDQQFKYAIDFGRLELDETIAAVCLSRPANPSGNVVTDEEVAKLSALCAQKNIPLIIDAAYGKPFPSVVFAEHTIPWDDNIIRIMSLSKLGLPGARTGIVVGNPEFIKKFSRATASLSLAPGNLGPMLGKSLLASGDLMRLANEEIYPFYKEKLHQTVNYLLEKSQHLPVKVHKAEGGFFLWVWLQKLPVTCDVLYEQLKQKGLLVVSGHHFFQPLQDKTWRHQYECLRLSYAQPWERVQQGIDLLIRELEVLYVVAPVKPEMI